MSRIVHLCLDVRGALLNWSDEDFDGLFCDTATGCPVGVREAKMFLLDELAKGHVVLPMAKPCEGFDYSGKGCPGHDVNAADAPSARAAGAEGEGG